VITKQFQLKSFCSITRFKEKEPKLLSE